MAYQLDKAPLINEIRAYLKQQLNEAILAANNARNDAIDDESVAETQYDTVAIEASYLAEGQSRRVEEHQLALQTLNEMAVYAFDNESTINLSALIQLEQDMKNDHWFFICPVAGGFNIQMNGCKITVVTPHSPIGAALMNQYVGDEIKVNLGHNERCDTITMVL